MKIRIIVKVCVAQIEAELCNCKYVCTTYSFERNVCGKGVYRVSIVKRPLLSTLPFLLVFYEFKK